MAGKVATRSIVLAIVVVALASTDWAARYVRTKFPGGVFAGAAAPLRFLPDPVALEPFTAVDLDGNEVSSAAWLGQVVLVNFWATWCGPCRIEMPALAALQEKYRGRLLIVGVLYDDPASVDTVRAVAKGLRVNYPVVPTTSAIERSFGEAPVLPLTYLVDAKGRVVLAHGGVLDVDALEKLIVELLPARTAQP